MKKVVPWLGLLSTLMLLWFWVASVWASTNSQAGPLFPGCEEGFEDQIKMLRRRMPTPVSVTEKQFKIHQKVVCSS